MEKSVDVVVIGSGPGGHACALRARQLGLSVACIERSPQYGGTCLNVGCIPSKTLLAASEFYAHLRDASHMGIKATGSCDFGAMMQKKEEVVQRLRRSLTTLFKARGVQCFHGDASFVDAHTLRIQHEGQDERVKGRYVVIATGSEPIALELLPFDEEKIVSSTGALALDKVPKSMIVVGGGAIGVELASVYARLGSDVTIVEIMSSLCTGVEKALTDGLAHALQKQGITLLLESRVVTARVQKDGVQLAIKTGDAAEKTLKASVVLVAVGRCPTYGVLNLANIGIVCAEKGFLSVDGSFRTSVPHVFAIGDVIEGPMLAHKAEMEGVVVAELIAGKLATTPYIAVPNVVYTYPELATVGFSEREARDRGLSVISASMPLSANPRAQCMHATEGLVKVVGNAQNQELLGLHILAPCASEMIALGSLALAKRVTIEELASLPFAHPTLSEAIKAACGAAIGQALYG